MRTKEVELTTGVKIGERQVRTATVREATVGDIMDAEEESRGLSSRMAVETLRRRIVTLGDLSGPIPMDIFRKLTEEDFERLNNACLEIDTPPKKEGQEPGRDPDGGAAAPSSDG